MRLTFQVILFLDRTLTESYCMYRMTFVSKCVTIQLKQVGRGGGGGGGGQEGETKTA